MLCGGGTKIPGVVEHWKNEINLPVKIVKEFDPALAVAIGLKL